MTAFIPSRLSRCLALLSCWLLLGPCVVASESDNSVAGEYEVKAVFLYNFTRFVEWPANAFASSNAPLVIAILGNDPFGDVLDNAVRNEVIRNHPLVVKRFRSGDPVPECQILFICRSEKERLDEILEKLQRAPVLTVADFSRAAERGAMINLIVKDSVKMEINLPAVTGAGLEISSKLLNIAREVKPERAPSSALKP
ncbi:MAG TPA: YfiR family protein [Verrucomicrobiae bacterium]